MGEFLDFVYKNFNYKLYIPDQYQKEKEMPLLVMLHGCGQDPDDFAAGTKMNVLAEHENFIVLYPDMNHLFNPADPAGYNPLGCWNWFLDQNQHRGKGHPKLIYNMIGEVKKKYSIDSQKVYAAGFSAGASLACILGVTYPDVYNGIAICSGLAYDAANVFLLTDPLAEAAANAMLYGVSDPYACGNSAFHEMGKYKRKMPVIVFHGTWDTTVHPINGEQVIIQWAQTNFLAEGGHGKADVTPAQVKRDTINGKSFTRKIYSDGNADPLLELWMVDQMEHAWSGGSLDGSFTDPSGPKATEIIWKFLSKNHFLNNESRTATPMEAAPKTSPMETEQIPLSASEIAASESSIHIQDNPSNDSTKGNQGAAPSKRAIDLVETNSESSTEARDLTPSEFHIESKENALSETSIKTQDKAAAKSPLKNLFRIVSKFTKKKR